MTADRWDDLVAHLVATTRLEPGSAVRVIHDVVAYFAEPTEAFVRRRHRELLADGLGNTRIFEIVAAELAHRPVAPPALSVRQLRRIVYG